MEYQLNIFQAGWLKSVEVSQWSEQMGTQRYILVISPGHLGDCTIILNQANFKLGFKNDSGLISQSHRLDGAYS